MDDNLTPAATVVIIREQPDGPPELLMIERAQKMAFAGGALVFPGGRVDPGDRAIAAVPELLGMAAPSCREEAAAGVAAIRETIEEVGIAIGIDPLPPPSAIAQLRPALAEGGRFAARR